MLNRVVLMCRYSLDILASTLEMMKRDRVVILQMAARGQ